MVIVDQNVQVKVDPIQVKVVVDHILVKVRKDVRLPFKEGKCGGLSDDVTVDAIPGGNLPKNKLIVRIREVRPPILPKKKKLISKYTYRQTGFPIFEFYSFLDISFTALRCCLVTSVASGTFDVFFFAIFLHFLFRLALGALLSSSGESFLKLNRSTQKNDLKLELSVVLRCVYTLRFVGPISYPDECDLMVNPRKYIVMCSRMHFVTFVRI